MRQFLPPLFLAITGAARAAEPPAPPELGGNLVSLLFGVIFVILLLLALLWLLKRVQEPRGAHARLVRVIAGAAVGARERVVVVEIGDSWLALGVAPGQVSLLAELPRRELPETAPADFAQRLKDAIRRHAP